MGRFHSRGKRRCRVSASEWKWGAWGTRGAKTQTPWDSDTQATLPSCTEKRERDRRPTCLLPPATRDGNRFLVLSYIPSCFIFYKKHFVFPLLCPTKKYSVH